MSNQVKFIYMAHFSQKEIRCGGRERERRGGEGCKDKWRSAEQNEIRRRGTGRRVSFSDIKRQSQNAYSTLK